jgi:hypothetical protein
MKTLTDIPIFQAGRHRDMNGAAVIITEVELKKTVSTYQPSLHEAPLVIGHPQHDAPAWGWVSGLIVENGVLLASVQQVDPKFSEIVKTGRYKKVSASFYTPDAANNPVPGTYYLRHVGFLGAQPPAIKGLGEASFHEKESGVITFTNQAAAQSTQQPSAQNENNDFSEISIKQENKMKKEQEQPVSTKEDLVKRQLELDKREAELTSREETIQSKEKTGKKNQLAQFVDQLIDEGRILPRDREGLLALMERLEDSGVIEFSEADSDGKPICSDAASYFKAFVAKLPVQVDFAESATTTKEPDHLAHYTTPTGYQVDRDGLATHNKILSYAKSRNVDYLTAALTIGN